MSEVAYRTVLMDRTDLRASVESIEHRLNEVRDMMLDDREADITYQMIVGYALHIEGIAASARKVLDLTRNEYP